MEIGRVIGRVWATKKDEQLNGQKLLVLKLLLERGEEKPRPLNPLYAGAVRAGVS